MVVLPLGPANEEVAKTRTARRDCEENDIVYTLVVPASKMLSNSVVGSNAEFGDVTIRL